MQRQGARIGFLDAPTVAYRTRHAIHYLAAGEALPAGAVNHPDPHADRFV